MDRRGFFGACAAIAAAPQLPAVEAAVYEYRFGAYPLFVTAVDHARGIVTFDDVEPERPGLRQWAPKDGNTRGFEVGHFVPVGPLLPGTKNARVQL